jgi:NADH-quinone oxidoreductase subunit J
MSLPFVMVAGLILASALAAVLLRKLVHSVLSLTVTFTALAALYLQLHAEFLGFAQILVYVGAVAILMVFAVLLTRQSGPALDVPIATPSWVLGVSSAILVLGCLSLCILYSRLPGRLLPASTIPPDISVQKIGEKLMVEYVLPLEVLGLLLTAALIGATVLALPETDPPTDKTRNTPC